MFNPIRFIEPIANSNSSSLHALIAPGSKLPLYPRGYSFFNRGDPHKVVASDKHVKMKFINGLVNGAGSSDLILGFIAKYPKWKYNVEASVDHQSRINCPKRGFYDIDYVELILQFFDVILRDDIDLMISGDEYITRDEVKKLKPHPMNELYSFLGNSDLRAVRHSQYGWSLYNTRYCDYTPVKMVLQMREGAEVLPSSCDMKITHYCEHSCKWCYQNCNQRPRGDHNGAPIERIMEFANQNYNIMEYALGGGDPLTHPKFKEIVTYLHKNGRLVNFTTRGVSGIKDLLDVPFDAIATSADDLSEMTWKAGALKMFRSFKNYGVSAHVHLITWPHIVKDIVDNISEVEDVLSDTGCKLVLLAPKMGTNPYAKKFWKQSLRKSGGRERYDDNMIKMLNEWRLAINTAVDTPIMRCYKDHIDFDPMYHFTTEGDMSIYYDAVEDKVYNSSYELVPFEYTEKQKKTMLDWRWA